MVDEQVVIAGAGPAGLATAAMLERAGVRPLVIDRAPRVAENWRNRYDSLILNTPRISSTLPGYRMPRRLGRWPTRDAVVEYLEDYVSRNELRLHFETEIERLDWEDGMWAVRTSKGDQLARFVVLATGHDDAPRMPDWPGSGGFTGELLHAADYRSPAPFRDRDVLIVGPNTSGSEIAFELASSAQRVRVAVRTPPYLTKREWPRGIPVNPGAIVLDLLPDRVADAVALRMQRVMFGDLTRYGLPAPSIGPQTNMKVRHQGGVFDAGFIDEVKAGRIELVGAVESFDGADVTLSDGTRIQPEVVIAATGYSRGLHRLVGHVGVLDEAGFPTVLGASAHPAAPGLYFAGFRLTISGQLRHMRRDARRIAKAISLESKRVT